MVVLFDTYLHVVYILCSVLRPLQHSSYSTGYMGDGFTGQKTQPKTKQYQSTEGESTKEKKHKQRRQHNTHRNTK